MRRSTVQLVPLAFIVVGDSFLVLHKNFAVYDIIDIRPKCLSTVCDQKRQSVIVIYAPKGFIGMGLVGGHLS
jgi:hypothetical protein